MCVVGAVHELSRLDLQTGINVDHNVNGGWRAEIGTSCDTVDSGVVAVLGALRGSENSQSSREGAELTAAIKTWCQLQQVSLQLAR